MAEKKKDKTETTESESEAKVYDFKPDEVKTTRAKRESKNEKYDAIYEKYIRLQADFDNFKKRNQAAGRRMYDEGVEDTLIAVLPTIDFLDMAIAAQKDEEQRKGIELVKKSFTDAIVKFGVEETDAEGKDFDPEFHDAAMNMAGNPEDVGKVVKVFKKGYVRAGKVLRHAVVAVGE